MQPEIRNRAHVEVGIVGDCSAPVCLASAKGASQGRSGEFGLTNPNVDYTQGRGQAMPSARRRKHTLLSGSTQSNSGTSTYRCTVPV